MTAAILKFCLLFPIALACAIWNGYVLSVLWEWFVVPMFHLPALRVPYAIGIAIVCSLLAHQSQTEENTPEPPEAIASGIVSPAVWLLFGWVVHLWT